MLASAGDLAVHISGIEEDLAKRVSLLTALEEKLTTCDSEKDELGMTFWRDRVDEKRKGVRDTQEELLSCQSEFNTMNDELDGYARSGQNLREYAEHEDRQEALRVQQTFDEIAAWKAGNDLDMNDTSFPSLEDLLHGPHGHRGPPWRSGRFDPHNYHRQRPFGRFGHPAFPHPPRRHRGTGGNINGPPPPPRPQEGFRNLIDRLGDVANNHPAIVQDFKSIVDGLLGNFTNQVGETFEGAPPIATPQDDTERPIPGAFVPQADVQTQTQAENKDKDKVIKPNSKLGKGGFRHKHISCDGCLTGIRGMRYKCEVSTRVSPYSNH